MYSRSSTQALQDNIRRGVFTLASRILQPLVRIFIRYGFSCQEFTELARWAFVQVAMSDPEFALPTRSRQFKSRAAVLTGLSRKEILRLMEYRDGPDPDSLPSSNRAARVLDGWSTDHRYCHDAGKPADLPLKGAEGTFHALVRDYSGDVPPRAVLDELRRCEAVELTGDGHVRLVRRQYHAAAGSREEIEMAAISAGDLLDTLDNNLRPGTDKLLQREVFSTMIPEASAQRVGEHLQEQGDRFAREVQQYLEIEEQGRGGPRVRVGLGLYRFGS